MIYEPKNFEHLIGLEGFNDDLLKNHFELYQGYVKNTNSLLELSRDLTKDGEIETPQFNELRRRLGWEFNGMRLHEYYFGNMSKNNSSAQNEDLTLIEQIKLDFGSYDNWEKDFHATGMIRGIGWAILYYDELGDILHNVWIGEHNINHLAGAEPILVMDSWEHAYMIQYGLNRKDYIKAFFKAIDWETIEGRFSSYKNN